MMMISVAVVPMMNHDAAINLAIYLSTLVVIDCLVAFDG
jgi:hypothetical protein